MEWEVPNWGDDEIRQDGVLVAASKKLEGKSLKMFTKNLNIHYNKVSDLENICPLPKTGEQFRIITEKQFNAFALILRLIEGKDIDEMYLAIYRINESTVKALIELIDSGKIKKGKFVISNFFNQTKKPEKWAIMLKEYCEKNKDFDHVYIHNHSKILACKSGENHYVFEGSGNMSDNARIEQYLYENNKESYEFHKSWMNEIL
jgi:hypothetical protein